MIDPAGAEILGVAGWITFAMLVAGVVLAGVRAVRGPSLPDRVVGLDTVTTLLVSFAALFAIASSEPAFLDIASVLALVGFLTTVAFARYVERSDLAKRQATACERDA